MRILLISHRYSPFSMGGVEIWTRAMSRSLSTLGYQVAVLARDHRGQGEAFQWHRAEQDGELVYWLQHQLSDARGFRETWNDSRLLDPLRAIFADFDPDIVHLAHPDGWGIVPLELARQQNRVTAATLHDYKWLCRRGQMLHPSGDRCLTIDEQRCSLCVGDQLTGASARAIAKRLAPKPLLRWARRQPIKTPAESIPPLAQQRWRTGHIALLNSLRDCDVLISPSRFVARRYQESGLGREVQVIANGLDLDLPQRPDGSRESGAARWSAPNPNIEGPLRIGFFANAHPSKGLQVLQSAVAALPAGSVHLHIHGPSEQTNQPACTVHGVYTRNELEARMNGIDLVAIPSLWDENQPLVALEARAFRKPLIVSDVGGLPELIDDNIDGWIVPAGQPEYWAERLAILAADRRSVFAAGLKGLLPQSAEAMSLAYLQAYRAALGEETYAPALTAGLPVEDNVPSRPLGATPNQPLLKHDRRTPDGH